MQTTIASIEAFVKQAMTDAAEHDLVIGHGYLHVDRVRRYAVQIGHREGFVRLDLVEATALLHDVGLPLVNDRAEHAAVSSALARDYLHQNALFVESEINAIVTAIAHHSDIAPIPDLSCASLDDSLTAIIKEADVLDALGAVGLMRAFMTKHSRPPYNPDGPAGDSWGLTADQFTQLRHQDSFPATTVIDQINLQIAIYDELRSQTARRLGAPRVAFMRAYVEQLTREITDHYPDSFPPTD